jgi:two-component system OmpR family response regulator
MSAQPVSSANALSRVSAGSRRPPAGRILVVEDNPELRQLSTLVLRRLGFQVDSAADGEAGWEALVIMPYDVLITDHEMPRLTGLGLIKRMRAASVNTPAILVSGRLPFAEPVLREIIGPGAALSKPFSFGEVVSEINRLLAKSRRSETSEDAPPKRATVSSA